MSYKETLFLPKTSFSMKANLKELEPILLQEWQNLPAIQEKKNKGKKRFILHSGPPFANGRSHLGHLLNFILKDCSCRYKYMQNYDVSFFWGWDCHGLPIEIKVEQEYKENKKDLSDKVAFRNSCREFANSWVQVQRQDLQRIGLMVNNKKYYSTMDYSSESEILSLFYEFLKKNLVYRDIRPVFWSIAEKTAFAEAEIQYVDNHKSTACYVTFPVQDHDFDIVIWTTTPWTLPCNRAICYSKNIEYAVVEIETLSEIQQNKSRKILIALSLLEDFLKNANISSHKVLNKVDISTISNLKCYHPLRGILSTSASPTNHPRDPLNDNLGSISNSSQDNSSCTSYNFDIPVLESDHVTSDMGTGFVHTAPSHGIDDYLVCKKNNIPAFDSVNESGVFTDAVEKYSGMHIFKSIDTILDDINSCGNLLHSYSYTHKYPYSWRSNTPLIFRTTSQWFIKFDDKLRDTCMKEIEKVKWIPEQGKTRITSMIQNRPDWCISRQRLWGVPLFLFVNKKTHAPLVHEEMFANILKYVNENGLDICFTDQVWQFLPSKYDKDDFYFVPDIIDVWFESGATHRFVTQKILGANQADLYLEGSDQHRGWFSSSLIASCALNEHAPYKTVLTHGFLLDEKGIKISKSKGNSKSVEELLNENGADILRLWALSCDSKSDMKIGNEVLSRVKDVYRKIRNVIRYSLGALNEFSSSEIVNYSDLCTLEKFILHVLNNYNEKISDAMNQYEFQTAVSLIHNFCNEVSANYFDMRKDSLYCDSANDIKRRSTRTVMNIIASYLIHWIAPILPFTSEDAWKNYCLSTRLSTNQEHQAICEAEKNQHAQKNSQNNQENNQHAQENNQDSIQNSIHLQSWPEVNKNWQNDRIYKIFNELFEQKKLINVEIEKARNEHIISGNLTAHVILKNFQYPDIDLTIEDFLGVSKVSYYNNSTDDKNASENSNENSSGNIKVLHATGKKCERCWRIIDTENIREAQDTRDTKDNGDIKNKIFLCNRCENVVNNSVNQPQKNT